jgi:hypothetical protein
MLHGETVDDAMVLVYGHLLDRGHGIFVPYNLLSPMPIRFVILSFNGQTKFRGPIHTPMANSLHTPAPDEDTGYERGIVVRIVLTNIVRAGHGPVLF